MARIGIKAAEKGPDPGAPPVINRSHVITAEVEVPPSGAEGVLVAIGGVVSGWSLYVDEQRRPVYTYNLFGVERTTLVGSKPLPAGETTIRFEFAYDGGGWGRGGTAKLSVDGEIVAEGRLGRTAPAFFSIDETFDIGVDAGSPAGEYPPHYAFTGRIKRVTVELE